MDRSGSIHGAITIAPITTPALSASNPKLAISDAERVKTKKSASKRASVSNSAANSSKLRLSTISAALRVRHKDCLNP